MADTWLPTLRTPDPQSGYELAIKLSRMSVKLTQPDAGARERLRTDYENDAGALIQVAAVVAANFRTVALANAFWRED